MECEHELVLSTGDGIGAGEDPTSDRSGTTSVERIRAAVEALRGVRLARVSKAEATAALDCLIHGQSVITSLTCDVGRHVSHTEPELDPADALREGARLPGQESRRMAKMGALLMELGYVEGS
jgi:hypothetical protein